jgi:hypothetical protein
LTRTKVRPASSRAPTEGRWCTRLFSCKESVAGHPGIDYHGDCIAQQVDRAQSGAGATGRATTKTWHQESELLGPPCNTDCVVPFQVLAVVTVVRIDDVVVVVVVTTSSHCP